MVLENSLESPLNFKEIQSVHPKDQSWMFIGQTDVEAETPILWPPDAKSWLIWKDWFWEWLKAGGEGDNRGWDGWMASPTQWAWVWVDSRSWWCTGRPVHAVVHGITKSRTWLSDWTELNSDSTFPIISPFSHTKHSLFSFPLLLTLYLSFLLLLYLPTSLSLFS